MLSDTSERAVIDAPLTLVTSPIAGEVRDINAVIGAAMLAGSRSPASKTTASTAPR
jgi:hypothetical protein